MEIAVQALKGRSILGAVFSALLFVSAIGLESPASASGARGWVDCGDPGEGQVVFIADLKARFVTCPRAESFARSYERKAVNRNEFFPRRHRGYRCSERQYGVESNRINCRRGTKRINFILGV
jgi:hypothetical protein